MAHKPVTGIIFFGFVLIFSKHSLYAYTSVHQFIFSAFYFVLLNVDS